MIGISSSAQTVSKGGTWKGTLLLVILTVLSVLSVNIIGRKVSFVFLPLIAIFLWPRIDTPIISIISILLLGFLLDILSAGPLGLWPLIFLSVFTLFRPDKRLKRYRFWSAFRKWIAVLTLAVVAAYLLGWFAMGRRPEIWALIYQAIAAVVLFPVVYGLRHLGRTLLSESDMGGL